MSLYSIRQQGSGSAQPSGGWSTPPWASVLPVGKALKDFYESRGDVTLTGANTIATIQDGPEKVVRYGNLTLGDGTTTTSLTASQRCKGLTIICDSLTVRANATLHMTGRGARVMTNDDPFFPFIDFKIPNQITLSSDRVNLATALAMIKANGWALWDQGTFQSTVAALAGFDLAVSQAGTLTLLSAAGCGNGGGQSATNNASWNPGISGSAGTSGGMGGGGGGVSLSDSTSYWGYGASGGKGCPYSGGSGGGGGRNGMPPSLGPGGINTGFSGPGGAPFGTAQNGGSGNPGGLSGGTGGNGGDGCGGKLVIICYGNVTVQSGGKIEANGVASSATVNGSGGGASGGGHVSFITYGTYTNSGTVQVAGGIGQGLGPGGSGGAGSVVTKTFNDMGWS